MERDLISIVSGITRAVEKPRSQVMHKGLRPWSGSGPGTLRERWPSLK